MKPANPTIVEMATVRRSGKTLFASGARARNCLVLAVFLLGLPLAPAFGQDAKPEEFGRLFFTPERRAALDRQRELNLPQEQQLGEDDTLTLNGLVTRSSGKRTIWLNGAPLTEDSTHVRFDASAAKPGAATVAAGNDPASTIAVGSTLNRTSGTVVSPLGSGSIRVRETTTPRSSAIHVQER